MVVDGRDTRLPRRGRRRRRGRLPRRLGARRRPAGRRGRPGGRDRAVRRRRPRGRARAAPALGGASAQPPPGPLVRVAGAATTGPTSRASPATGAARRRRSSTSTRRWSSPRRSAGSPPASPTSPGCPTSVPCRAWSRRGPGCAPGSVGLADTWCGVYPTASPGGWLLIGTTDAACGTPTAPSRRCWPRAPGCGSRRSSDR